MKIGVALLIGLAAPAQAEDWRKVASNLQGVDYYVQEQDTHNGSNPAPLIWVKTDNRREDLPRWASSLAQIQIDCAKQNFQLFAAYAYDDVGKVKESQTVALGQRRHSAIPRGSIWAEIARWTCPR